MEVVIMIRWLEDRAEELWLFLRTPADMLAGLVALAIGGFIAIKAIERFGTEILVVPAAICLMLLVVISIVGYARHVHAKDIIGKIWEQYRDAWRALLWLILAATSPVWGIVLLIVKAILWFLNAMYWTLVDAMPLVHRIRKLGCALIVVLICGSVTLFVARWATTDRGFYGTYEDIATTVGKVATMIPMVPTALPQIQEQLPTVIAQMGQLPSEQPVLPALESNPTVLESKMRLHAAANNYLQYGAGDNYEKGPSLDTGKEFEVDAYVGDFSNINANPRGVWFRIPTSGRPYWIRADLTQEYAPATPPTNTPPPTAEATITPRGNLSNV